MPCHHWFSDHESPEPARNARVIEPAPHTTAQEDATEPPTPPMAMTERGADAASTPSISQPIQAPLSDARRGDAGVERDGTGAGPRPTTADQDAETPRQR